MGLRFFYGNHHFINFASAQSKLLKIHRFLFNLVFFAFLFFLSTQHSLSFLFFEYAYNYTTISVHWVWWTKSLFFYSRILIMDKEMIPPTIYIKRAYSFFFPHLYFSFDFSTNISIKCRKITYDGNFYELSKKTCYTKIHRVSLNWYDEHQQFV